MTKTKHITHEMRVCRIREKWHEQTSTFRGHFIRFLDGDRSNCSAKNLSMCSPYEAFSNPDWVVDWDMDLTDDEIEFVRANMSNFQTIYDPN